MNKYIICTPSSFWVFDCDTANKFTPIISCSSENSWKNSSDFNYFNILSMQSNSNFGSCSLCVDYFNHPTDLSPTTTSSFGLSSLFMQGAKSSSSCLSTHSILQILRPILQSQTFICTWLGRLSYDRFSQGFIWTLNINPATRIASGSVIPSHLITYDSKIQILGWSFFTICLSLPDRWMVLKKYFSRKSKKQFCAQ